MDFVNRTFVAQADRSYADAPNSGTESWSSAQSAWNTQKVRALHATFADQVAQFLRFAARVEKAGLAYARVTTEGGIEVMAHGALETGQNVVTAVVGRHSHADSSASAAALALRHVRISQHGFEPQKPDDSAC